MTNGADQLVALHSSSQDDILLCLQRGELCPNQDRVGELVGSMVDHFTRSVLSRPAPQRRPRWEDLHSGFIHRGPRCTFPVHSGLQRESLV